MNNIYGLIFSVIYIILVLGIANVFMKAGKEASRKFIHIMLSNWWIIAMVFFDNVFYAALLPAVFVVLNYLSYRYDLIKTMERDEEDCEKSSLGTVYYAISLLIISILSFGVWKNPEVGLVGIIVMGYGDGFAAIVGRNLKSKEFKFLNSKKTLAGSLTMFIISLMVVSGALYYFNVPLFFAKGMLIAFVATVLEFFSIKGTDNLTVPIATTILTYMFL